MDEPRHPVGPEIDDSGNPTHAAPEPSAGEQRIAETSERTEFSMGEDPGTTDYGRPAGADYSDAAGADPSEPLGGDHSGSSAGGASEPSGGRDAQGGGRRQTSGRDMLAQLQQMIDTLAVQAQPVMRDVAAKAAELAAVAAERAGPLAQRAAGATERVGERVAARSKEMAADLRRSQEHASAGTTDDPGIRDSTGGQATAGQSATDWAATEDPAVEIPPERSQQQRDEPPTG